MNTPPALSFPEDPIGPSRGRRRGDTLSFVKNCTASCRRVSSGWSGRDAAPGPEGANVHRHSVLRSLRLGAGAAVLVGLLLLTGCKTACREVSEAYCSQCASSVETYDELGCLCVDTGVLYRDDADDVDLEGFFDTDNEAQQWCDRMTHGMDNTADDVDARCQASLEYMKLWPGDVCPET